MEAPTAFSNALSSIISAAYSEPRPSPVKVKVLRVPVDNTRPHRLELETTHAGIDCGPDSFLSHIPDFRKYWGSDGWQKRDLRRFRLSDRSAAVNGVYYCFWSPCRSLPRNAVHARLRAKRGLDREAWGDIFMVRMAGSEFGEGGWAKYEHIREELMKVPMFLEVLGNIACG
ncbi:hypothetical protein MMC26_001168 [Xylographa opegraphella]|nr:hypothetical protein [Xylographa opegraphella]